jgi:hypothetical protein
VNWKDTVRLTLRAEDRFLRGEFILGALYLYSTNPWYSHEVAEKYLGEKHFVWCADCYDPTTLSSVSATAMIAPSSSPKGIFDKLYADTKQEEKHSDLIYRYKRTFRKLAATWLASGVVTLDQKNEIVATVNSVSWKIWRPLLYIIYRPPIDATSRLINVPIGSRAGYGGEWKIVDLQVSEFEIIER